MARKLVVFGSGGMADLADFYFRSTHQYEVVAFTVDDEYVTDDSLSGRPVIPASEALGRFPPSEHSMFVAMGYNGVNAPRQQKFEWAKGHGYHLPAFVSPQTTFLSDQPVGENCFILEDNTIQPFVRIGNNVTLWAGNHIGHHSRIRDHAFLSSHVVVSGGVKIGQRCFIGVNATIRDDVTIGDRSIIGAGALILRDTAEDSLYVGSRTEPGEQSSGSVTRI